MSASQPRYRVDGIAKVTGKAQYGADFHYPRLAHGVLVLSTIAKGTITSVDTSATAGIPGVITIISHKNALRLHGVDQLVAMEHPVIALLQDNEVHYCGQPVAIVVAETIEIARHAAALVKFEYQQAPAILDFSANLHRAEAPKTAAAEITHCSRGDVDGAIRRAIASVEARYESPAQYHNAMEPHAAIAVWDGDKLFLHEPSQWIMHSRKVAATLFGLPEENVRLVGPYVGGGFGGKGALWSHSALAAMAAKMIGRPVKISLQRRQMYTTTGGRPRILQNFTIASDASGRLLAIKDHVTEHSSSLVELVENSGTCTERLYDSETAESAHKIVQLDVPVTSSMRGPGEATGTFALGVAMDELAQKLGVDPLALRLKNYATKDPKAGKPYSSKLLRECYERGASRFGWSRRNHTPRSMRDGRLLIGWGMATATYPAYRDASSAIVQLRPDGTVFVGSATHEIGTGTYTVLAQIAAEALAVDMKQVVVRTGDTNLPNAIYSGGSMTVVTVGTAVLEAAQRVRSQAIDMAVRDHNSPLFDAAPDEIDIENGFLFLKSAPEKRDTYANILRRNGNRTIESTVESKPDAAVNAAYSMHSFGAVFAEVAVDPDVYTVHVRRFTGVYDVGRLINKKAGLNQLAGGVVWGISMALFEGTRFDSRYGRIVNADLSEYHLPTNADIGELDITALDVPDTTFNPLGARGVGEMGITGAVAAVANAVYHATGKRVRDLPITVDKLLAA